ncbi:MAG TPA: energy transducer TonB [Polyangiales bacterium]
MSEGTAASDGTERAERRTLRPEERPPARSPARASAQRTLAPVPTQMGRHFAARVFGVIGVSLGTHMALMGALGFIPSPLIALRKEVQMEIIQPAPPPPPPPPPAAEEPKPPEPAAARPKLAPKISPPKPATEPEPPKNEPPPAAEAPVDLTGVTLTGDGASWSSVVGNGSEMQGPAARIGRVTGRDRAGNNAGAIDGRGTTLVGEASLSRKPVPPDGMNELLEQNFPPRARAQGVAGTARLRVRILADGRVGEMKILRESGDYGFGIACEKTLRMRRWQAPLDKAGTPVATEITYTCEFEVGY